MREGEGEGRGNLLLGLDDEIDSVLQIKDGGSIPMMGIIHMTLGCCCHYQMSKSQRHFNHPSLSSLVLLFVLQRAMFVF